MTDGYAAALPNDWFDVGWGRFLPRQALDLALLIGGATIAELDGVATRVAAISTTDAMGPAI